MLQPGLDVGHKKVWILRLSGIGHRQAARNISKRSNNLVFSRITAKFRNSLGKPEKANSYQFMSKR